MPRRRAAALALACGVLVGSGLVASPAPRAAAAAGSVDAARQEVAALRGRVEELSRRIADTTSTYESARDDLGLATAAQVQSRRDLDEATEREAREQAALRGRVRGLYASGGGVAVLAGLFAGGNPADLVGRAAVLSDVLAADREAVRSTEQARRQAEQAEDDVTAAARHQIALNAEVAAEAVRLEGLLAEQSALLDAADAEVRRLLEEEAREQAERRAAELAAAVRAAAGRVPGGTGALAGSAYGGSSADAGSVFRPTAAAPMACPVGRVHSFVDTWLAARSGGRRHQGTDVFAPHGSSAYAVVDGVVDKVGNGGLGGITLWIRSDAGDRYYYAHNSANLVAVGQRVVAGEPVALVGKTGNAASTPPHVHFEAHPGGGPAANPYPLLRSLCG